MLPEFTYWILVWWGGWFALLLDWYSKSGKPKISPMVAFFMAVFAGLIPLIIVFYITVEVSNKLRRK